MRKKKGIAKLKNSGKLQIHRETLRRLETGTLKSAHGAADTCSLKTLSEGCHV